MSEMVALRDLPEVEELDWPERLSMSFLQHFDLCKRSGYFYLKWGGGATSHPMDVGSAFHLFAEKAAHTLHEQGEAGMDPDTAKGLMGEVLAESRELTIPVADHDRLRVMAYHWACGFPLSPDKTVAIERKFTLDLQGYTIVGKLDYAELDGETAWIPDYKTSWNMPAQEEYEDGLQGRLYALLFAFGIPEGGDTPLGKGVKEFRIGEWYPRYLREDGEMQRRETVLTRTDLHAILADLSSKVGDADQAFKTRKFPAVPGSQCQRCPSPHDCPLPAKLRDFGGIVQNDEQARAAGEKWLFMTNQARSLKKQLREYGAENGPIRIAEDLVLDWKPQERRKLDTEGIALAAEQGERFNVEEFQKVSTSTTFDKRKLSKDEKAEWDEAA